MDSTATWIITGASRGLGLEIAKAAIAQGLNVVATARNPEGLSQKISPDTDKLLTLPLDVTNAQQISDIVDKSVEKFGGVDVLVNNAGFGQLGYFETISPEKISDQFTTNVFGLMEMTRAVLPVMRHQQRGHVVNLSSIGGFLGFTGASIYCASKFAVEGLTESLAHELKPYGIGFTIVEPGFFRTDFLEKSSVRYGDIEVPGLENADAGLQAEYKSYNQNQPGNPASLAKIIVQTILRENPPLRIVAGTDALEFARSAIAQRIEQVDSWAAVGHTTEFQTKGDKKI